MKKWLFLFLLVPVKCHADIKWASPVGILSTTNTWQSPQTFSSETVTNLNVTTITFADGTSLKTAPSGSGGGGGDNFGSHISTQNVAIGTNSVNQAILTVSTGSAYTQPLLKIATNTTTMMEVMPSSVTINVPLTVNGGFLPATNMQFNGVSGSTIAVANDPSGNGIGQNLVIIAGNTTGGSARPIGNVIIKTGAKNSGSGSAITGASIDFMTTKTGTSINTFQPELRGKFTGKDGYLSIGTQITDAKSRGIVTISTPGTMTGDDSMLLISSGGIPVFEITNTSATFGPGVSKVTMKDASLGIGISSPLARVDIMNTVGSSSYSIRIGTDPASGSYHVAVTTNGAFSLGGGSPTVSSCGTLPNGLLSHGSNQVGVITVGGGVVNSCTLNFNPPFNYAPVCNVNDNNTGVTADINAISASAVTFGFSVSLGGGTLYYICMGNQE